MIRQRSDILAATNYSGKWVDSAQVWTATSRGYTWGQTKENLSPLLHLSRKRNEYGEKRENENLEPTPKHNNKWQKCVSCQGSTFAVRCTFLKLWIFFVVPLFPVNSAIALLYCNSFVNQSTFSSCLCHPLLATHSQDIGGLHGNTSRVGENPPLPCWSLLELETQWPVRATSLPSAWSAPPGEHASLVQCNVNSPWRCPLGHKKQAGPWTFTLIFLLMVQ